MGDRALGFSVSRTRLDPTGNLAVLDPDWSDEARELPLERRVLRVRVATWPDGTRVDRMMSRSDDRSRQRFKFSSTGLPRPGVEVTSVSFGTVDVEIPTVVESHRFHPDAPAARTQFQAPYDHLRWFVVRMGLQQPLGSPVPLSKRPTRDNPWVGRFKGRTVDEVRADAAEVDRWLTTQPEDAVEVAIHHPRLFADDTWLVRRFEGWQLEWDERHDSALPNRPLYRFELQRPAGPSRWDTVVTTRARTVSDLVDHYMDRVSVFEGKRQHEDWAVLPLDEAVLWWDEHTKAGSFTVPDDELEVFSLLGEPMPWLWPDERLARWALDRWGLP